MALGFMPHSSGVFKYMKVAFQKMTSDDNISLSPKAEVAIFDLKEIIRNGPIPRDEREFLINGWRWHTASAIRDVRRFQAVLSNTESNFIEPEEVVKAVERVKNCAKHVFGFNLKGLIRVETEVFFPWLRKLLPASSEPIFSDLLLEQSQVKSLTSQVSNMCAELKGVPADKSTLKQVSEKVRQIEACCLKIQEVQVLHCPTQNCKTIFVEPPRISSSAALSFAC